MTSIDVYPRGMAAPPGSSSTDDALDELYGAAPGEFVTVRNTLRDRLRDAGEPDAARAIARARRPTTAAWALNQLAREHPDLIEAVLERTSDLAALQARALPGQADEIRDATAQRRRALEGATDAAVVIASRVTDNAESYRHALLAAIEGGSLDDEGAAGLRAGRHVRDVPGRTGFPGASAGGATPSRRAAPTAPERSGGKVDATARAGDEDHDDEASEEARAELERAERDAAAAAEQARERAAAAEEADARVAAAENAVERAHASLREAKRAARETRASAQQMKRSADAAAKAVDVARRRLTSLEG